MSQGVNEKFSSHKVYHKRGKQKIQRQAGPLDITFTDAFL
jgi:hypothetical protein